MEQYGCLESPTFSGFEGKENKSTEECGYLVKNYIKNSLNVDIKQSEYNRIHIVGPKIKKNGKTFQQIIIKFVPQTKIYRARKHKAELILSKLIKFLCCIMLIVSVLLVGIYTIITLCKSVIYNGHILYFSLLTNYLCQVWFCKLHVTLSRVMELNPRP